MDINWRSTIAHRHYSAACFTAAAGKPSLDIAVHWALGATVHLTVCVVGVGYNQCWKVFYNEMNIKIFKTCPCSWQMFTVPLQDLLGFLPSPHTVPNQAQSFAPCITCDSVWACKTPSAHLYMRHAASLVQGYWLKRFVPDHWVQKCGFLKPPTAKWKSKGQDVIVWNLSHMYPDYVF